MKTASCFGPAHILLPGENIPLEKWGCVACDQFTSDRAYWEQADAAVGGCPSTLRLILPEVYLEDKDAAQRVEYAIRMPGVDGNSVWLPIDSKFPGDTYAHLQDAQASGDAQAVENARHALELVLRSEAKDIREKYVEPPYTTAFGILFLPFEGLYAEVVNAGLLEVLQRDYQVNVAGPSTMAALLNSLQMGFKTLAIQKRSGEVWQLLGAVKTEFDKFGQGLSKMQQRLRQTDEELDNLIGVRSRAISRKLRAVQTLDENTAATLLELDTEPGRPVTARLPESGEEL